MTVDEYMWRYRDALCVQARALRELAELRDRAEGLRGALSGGVSYTLRTKQQDGTVRSEDAQTFMPIAKGKHAPTEAIDAYSYEEEATLRAVTEQAVAARHAVQTAICSVPEPRYQRLLSLRYIEGLRWPAVESELEVDHATGVRWHNAARRHLERNFLKNIL